MSNPTIELGGGKWATKPTSLLAYNNHPEWGYNPKEFTVDRNSTATCVGSDGLIKTVQANEARIDYSNDPNGALLVEPQRVNLITYSNDFNVAPWVKTKYGTGATPVITPNYALAPDGTMTASRIVFDIGTGNTFDDQSYMALFGLGSTEKTGSIYIKSNTGSNVNTYVRAGALFDDSNKVVATTEWQRFTETQANGDRFLFGARGSDFTDSVVDILVWGCQSEEASTASSYIPTNGTTVTRLVEENIENVGTELSSTQVTAFIDWDRFVSEEWLPLFNIGTDNDNCIKLNQYGTDRILYVATTNGSSITNSFLNNINKGQNKTAFKVENGEFKIFNNGLLLNTHLLTDSFINLIGIHLGGKVYSNSMNGKIRNFKVFNQALTDQELIDLTTI
jgi:hypothetical protein